MPDAPTQPAPRLLTIGAAQLGPVARDEPREHVVERMLALLSQAAERSVRSMFEDM